MIKKIVNYIWNDIKEFYIYYLILLVFILSNLITLDYEIYSSGGLVNLDDRIIVEDEYKTNGSFNLTYVTSRKGTLFNIGLSYLIPSWDLVSVSESRISNESVEDIFARGQVQLKMTSYDGIIVAFKSANLPYEISNINLYVSFLYDYSITDLEVGDIIKKVNGKVISSFDELRNELSNYSKNDRITLNVLRNEKEVECFATLKEIENNIVIGVSITQVYDVKTTPKVEFVFDENESGSSRGLMCALDIYNKITEFDLSKGKRICGTGSIDENGNVGSIGGVKYKLKGAIKKDCDVFIVPSENYDETMNLVKKNKYSIDIIKANTLDNVIDELKEM